jgi:hypothetical protein
VILSISPKKAETSELFPEPTDPTTATREPCLKLRLMLRRTTCSSDPHENVPFSIRRGFSEINNRFHHLLLTNIKFSAPLSTQFSCILIQIFRIFYHDFNITFTGK